MRREGVNDIAVTLSQKLIKERRGGLRTILREWAGSTGEDGTWWYRVATAPKEHGAVNYVYWVVAGKLQYRCRLLGIDRSGQPKQFANTSVPKSAKCWLVLFDFERLPPSMRLRMKGFRGFRYIDVDAMAGAYG